MTYPGEVTDHEVQSTETGLRYIDMRVGTGARPTAGSKVTVHYTGYLLDGRKIDSSIDRQEPFTFVLGHGHVIRGWDEGVGSMNKGGKRKLIIPSELAYGKRGIGSVIPPNAELVFDVELLDVR